VSTDGTGKISTFRVGPRGSTALLVTREVLEHHPANEIIAALSAHHVPQRLRERARMRLTCLRVRGRIVVQGPPVAPG
jgi:hypothetical protein